MDASSEDSAAQSTVEVVTKTKLQLPASCDPPQPDGERKQLVWVVSHGD